jgi:hypothetical protein
VNRYAGKWYEIARMDHSFERGLSDVSATYRLAARWQRSGGQPWLRYGAQGLEGGGGQGLVHRRQPTEAR